MENNQKGGKEQGLLELQKHAHNCGYIIPEFSVISESDNEQEIIKIADRFKGKDIIVRSNSVMENTEFGFDGIYKTVVVKNCNFKELKEAYKEVSDSLFSKDAISYRNKAGIPHANFYCYVVIHVTERLTESNLRFPVKGTGPLACLSLFPVAGCG